MPDQPVDDNAIREAVDRLHQGTAQYGARPSDVAHLAATCAIRLAHEAADLTANLFTAKRQLVGRLDELTKVLDTTRLGMEQASKDAAEHTHALVRWTKVQAWAAGVYTVITGGLLGVAIWTLLRTRQ